MIDKSGKPIRGKLDPFREVLDPLLPKASTNNGIELFRESLKDAVGQRMRCTNFKPLKINENCIKIIESYFDDKYISTFVTCSILYYCNSKNHIIDNINTSCSCCSSRDNGKSVKHAQKDCIKCGNYYTKQIKAELLRKNTLATSNIIKKCNAMNIAISFFSTYISELLIGNLPSKLKKETFDRLNPNDSSIQNYYSYNEAGGYYVLNKKNTPYKSIRIESATEIFCSCFHFDN